MVIEEEDLGLSLSLSVSSTTPDRSHSNENRGASLPLNLMPPLVASAPASQFTHFETISRIDSLPSPDWSSESCRAVEARSFLRGFDVNRPPASADDEEARVSSPNSTVSSLSGKRSERDNNGGDDHEIEAASCHGISDDEDGDTSRKKVRLSKDQSAILEETFKEQNTLNPKQKLALANRIGLRPRQVEVWFQNRRARTKLKQTEVDCEVLKSCCKQLTEENRRLQKEVRELRALKLSPQFYMQMPPPTTLTMCPSCERVSVPPSSSTARRPGDSRSKPAASLSHRSVPMNPRVTAPLPIRPIDSLLPPP